MKTYLVLVIVLVGWGICACAASPASTASAGQSDPGDRELKKGIYWYQRGCHRKALDHFHAAHEHYSLTDRQAGVARSLNSLGNVYRQTEDVDSAMLFYDATIYFTRGRLMMSTGRYPEAMDLFKKALEMDRQAGFSRGMADDLSAMATIHEQLGAVEAALGCLDRSIKIHALVEDRKKVLENLGRLESLAQKTGTDVRVTVHFINQWLAGEAVDAICR